MMFGRSGLALCGAPVFPFEGSAPGATNVSKAIWKIRTLGANAFNGNSRH